MEIKAEVTNTIEDIQKAYSLHIGKIKLRHALSFVFVILSIPLLCLELYYSYPFNIYFLWILILLFGCYRIWWLCTLGKRMVKKNPSLLNKFTVIFTDEELHIYNEIEDSKIKWQAFTNLKITDEMVVLYPNQTMFYFFSKKFFSESDYAKLSDKANQIIAKNKSNNSRPQYRDSKPHSS